MGSHTHNKSARIIVSIFASYLLHNKYSTPSLHFLTWSTELIKPELIKPV